MPVAERVRVIKRLRTTAEFTLVHVAADRHSTTLPREDIRTNHVNLGPQQHSGTIAANGWRTQEREPSEAIVSDVPGSIDGWGKKQCNHGQQGMLSRIWAHKGALPWFSRHRGLGYCCLFSAARSDRKQAAEHFRDRASNNQIGRNLIDIRNHTETGSQAVVLLDDAGWNKSRDPVIPKDTTLHLHHRNGPEIKLNENVCEYMKQHQLRNRVFDVVQKD